uniref:(northern house mosquito) hypothetical protein n=1 Tax=Culex pipiens TaxID=7175 RepID=A0A8D8BX48_CULPI
MGLLGTAPSTKKPSIAGWSGGRSQHRMGGGKVVDGLAHAGILGQRRVNSSGRSPDDLQALPAVEISLTPHELTPNSKIRFIPKYNYIYLHNLPGSAHRARPLVYLDALAGRD